MKSLWDSCSATSLLPAYLMAYSGKKYCKYLIQAQECLKEDPRIAQSSLKFHIAVKGLLLSKYSGSLVIDSEDPWCLSYTNDGLCIGKLILKYMVIRALLIIYFIGPVKLRAAMGQLGNMVDLDSLDGGLTIAEFKAAKILRDEWGVQTFPLLRKRTRAYPMLNSS